MIGIFVLVLDDHEHLCHDTAHAPQVNLVVIELLSKNDLRRPVEPAADVVAQFSDRFLSPVRLRDCYFVLLRFFFLTC